MLKRLRLNFGIFIGKILVLLLKIRGSEGTALPGLVVEKIVPRFLAEYRQYLGIVIVITGTNGKTSTQTLLNYFLSNLQAGRVISNHKGANLSRGLIAELVKNHQFGHKNHNSSFTILEVEEATLPRIIKQLQPNYLVVTNFFRDQLDAYGEIERTKQHIIKAIQDFPQTELIFNFDDPQVRDLAGKVASLNSKIAWVSIANSESFLKYEATANEQVINLPENTLVLSDLSLNDNLQPNFSFANEKFVLSLPGLHNVYSFGFTAAVLRELNLDKDDQTIEKLQDLAKTAPVPFGRGEILANAQIFLIKNPVGFNLMLELLQQLQTPLKLVVLINDKIADGRDVSWLWDSQIELLQKLSIEKIWLSGSRALDMKLRVKYAAPELLPKVEVMALENLAEMINSGAQDSLFRVLATYTAMNQLRKLLLTRMPAKTTNSNE